MERLNVLAGPGADRRPAGPLPPRRVAGRRKRIPAPPAVDPATEAVQAEPPRMVDVLA